MNNNIPLFVYFNNHTCKKKHLFYNSIYKRSDEDYFKYKRLIVINTFRMLNNMPYSMKKEVHEKSRYKTFIPHGTGTCIISMYEPFCTFERKHIYPMFLLNGEIMILSVFINKQSDSATALCQHPATQKIL